jgi:hypothetical protein
MSRSRRQWKHAVEEWGKRKRTRTRKKKKKKEKEKEKKRRGGKSNCEGLRVSVVVWGMMVSAGASFQQQAGAGASRQARTRSARP